jgi:hypothetical protein
MGRQTSGKRLTTNAYLRICRIKGHPYLQLTAGETRVYLGRLNPDDPASMLDVSLKRLDDLTIEQIRALLRADKSMREPGRKPGRHPKRPALFGARF